VKKLSTIQASHVNSGTSVDRKDLGKNEQRGREFRHPQLEAEVEPSDTTAYGGLSLAASLFRLLRVPQRLDSALALLCQHRPFSESDHVLTHVYNLYVGGNCIEDIGHLQQSEAARRTLGAVRIPDPTTAGDFLRRFDAANIASLNAAIDEVHEDVWRRVFDKKQRELAIVDIDSHVHLVYGNQKEGADFTYKGTYGYHPLAITLSATQEILRLLNRPGNVTSADGAAVLLDEIFPLLTRNFKSVLLRGDSAFAQQDIFDVCEEHDQYFAVVAPCHGTFQAIAESLPDGAWKPFRAKTKSTPKKKKKRRRRGKNLRRKKARTRGMRDLKLQKQWIAEVPYQPSGSDNEYRLIIRKRQVEESKQGQLFTVYDYRFVLSNLPESYSAEQVARLTYQRCDQENVIEQLQNGIAAMRMPAASFAANAAFLVCSRLAHNIKPWLAMLALPAEVMRWEWKRFRQAFVYFAARVIHKARQVIVRIADSHRFATIVHRGIMRLQV